MISNWPPTASAKTCRSVSRRSFPAKTWRRVAVVMLASQGFRINVTTTRPIYLDSESFLVHVQTTDAKGDPTGKVLEVVAFKREVSHERVVEREVTRKKVETDAKTGKADVELAIEDKDGGDYIIRALGVDQFQTTIVADLNLSISGSKDPVKLRLITDASASTSARTPASTCTTAPATDPRS